ncbi:MAG TPA: transcription antitermination factor NusB [Candidatus Paceibacterota bacterium]|nr:transcription antitermination factor NusB [Candidatus Paceibacterota bacterium]
MANRHLSRSIVLQSLFSWDFMGRPADQLTEIVDRNIIEFAPGHNDSEFIHYLADLVQKKQAVIDEIIQKAAPEWPLDKIANVDRSILRMGLAELLFGNRDQVPPKVAINEAIELAKTYGGENSGRFVNGVLGAVYKEIGEPGKEQTSKQKVKAPEEPIDPEKLPKERKAGGIVYAKHDGKYYLALVHDVFGYWTIAKGGVEGEETDEQTAVREIKEKLGIEVTVKEKLGAIEYVASHPEKGKLLKIVTYFLAESEFKDLVLHSSGGLDNAAWLDPVDLVDLPIYDDILPLIAKAIEYITNLK